jgi:hypothetical protein
MSPLVYHRRCRRESFSNIDIKAVRQNAAAAFNGYPFQRGAPVRPNLMPTRPNLTHVRMTPPVIQSRAESGGAFTGNELKQSAQPPVRAQCYKTFYIRNLVMFIIS